MNDYGSRLKAALNAKGVKQVELADAVGSNPKNISSYIAGRSEPTLETANKIAKYLEVPMDYFLGNLSFDSVSSGTDAIPFFNELRKHLTAEVCDMIELTVMLKNSDIKRIFEIIKSLNAEGVSEVLKQAEKEYFVHMYKK